MTLPAHSERNLTGTPFREDAPEVTKKVPFEEKMLLALLLSLSGSFKPFWVLKPCAFYKGTAEKL